MGNQDTKAVPDAAVSEKTANPQKAQHAQIFNETFKAVTGNGQTELSRELLEVTFFHGFSDLSSLIYNCLQSQQLAEGVKSASNQTDEQQDPPNNQASCIPTKANDTCITEKTFVDFASELSQKHFFQECFDFYVNLFASNKVGLDEKDCSTLLNCCCKSGLVICGCPNTDTTGNQSINSAVHSMHSQAREGVLHKDQLQAWILKNSPRLLDSLHTFVCTRLKTTLQNEHTASDTSPCNLYLELQSDKYLLSVAAVCLLSCQLSPSYFPSNTSSRTDPLLSTIPLNNILQDGWEILYNSNLQGLSVNRFQHHVFQYKGPTVTLISFEGHCHCLSINEEWKEDTKFWGGSECSLNQLEPQFKLVQGGSDLVFLNWSQRSLPKGLQIGNQSRTCVLELDKEFSAVKHYGIELPLHRIEVWGCAGKVALGEQQKQRAWEKKDTQKHKDRKIKIDDWEDSPDRQLLEWGGVRTRHNERM